MRRELLAAPPARIVVFRALMLGDLLNAVPALRALRGGFPHARLTLVGLPWARELAARLSCVDDFIAFPGHADLPEVEAEPGAWPRFLQEVRSRRFDLALQLHGSGRTTNPLVAAFGARRTAGFIARDAWCPPADAALFTRWPEQGHEIERLLRLIDHLGIARCGTRIEFPLQPGDRTALRALWPAVAAGRPYVCVHAGAQLPSRRWGVRRFAAVADAIADCGRTIVLTGSAGEAGLVAEVRASMRNAAVDLSGRTTLWTLGALIEQAETIVCNDTGVSHVAAAVGCRSVVVSCGADPARWAPLDRNLHRVLAHPVPCRPCDFRVCPIGHDCAAGTTPEQVLQHYRSAPASMPRSTSAASSSSS